MSPSTTHISTHLRQLIYYHLDNNLLRNALFLASRLSAYEPRSPEAAYLLALCQFQSGQAKAAWDSSRLPATRGNHLGCCYIYAQASLELGRYVDGITALERSKPLWQNRNSWGQHGESRRQHLPDAAAVYCLEGKLFKAYKDMTKAVDCWAEALKLNPFMWDAFLGLCDAGAKVNISNIYQMNPDMLAMLQQMQRSDNGSTAPLDKPAATAAPLQAQPTNHSNQSHDPFMSSQPKVNGSNPNYTNTALWEKLNGSKVSVATVSTIAESDGTDTPATRADLDEAVRTAGNPDWEPPLAPARKPRSAQELGLDLAALPPPKMRAGSIKSKIRTKADLEDPTVLQDPPAQGPPPPAPPTKRTISGQAAQTSMSQTNNIEATRRSTRLQNTARPTAISGPSKMSALASSLGLREGRDIKKARAPGTKGRIATTSTVGRVVSGNRNRAGSSDTMDIDTKEPRPTTTSIPPVPSIPSVHHKSSHPTSTLTKDTEALQSLLDLFSRISTAHLALTHFDCQLAIQTYNSLPSAQRETPHVLAQIGRAYYEQASYADAEKFFVRVRNLAPSRAADMELYSTVLWHTKNDIELAYLAHELVEVDRLSPQAWVAVGNSFSLAREHDQALKCFRRATQLDPGFAYGFTLQGHEFVANEEFEKALDAYRSAVAADGRHYNAWYGLGKVYEKMGKWDVAETHYRTAARINPTNAVLVCCVGVVLEKLKKPEQALQMYGRACALAPGSALARFKKARCLMGLGRLREALGELLVLKDVAPEEANVHFLLGRLYKGLRMRGEAVRSFTMALNLDPKAAQFIKDAMESLDDEDEEEEGEEDEDVDDGEMS